MAAAFFNTPEKSVVSLFHDPPGACSCTALLAACRYLVPIPSGLGDPFWLSVPCGQRSLPLLWGWGAVVRRGWQPGVS